MTLARLARRGLLAAGICTVLLAAALPVAIDRVGVAPRTLAPYIEKRTSGHNPAISTAAARQGTRRCRRWP